MLSRLAVAAGAFAALWCLYLACVRSTPRRGFTRALERLCAGAALFYLCGCAASLLGARLAQGPLAAVATGLWGLPGAALAALAQLAP